MGDEECVPPPTTHPHFLTGHRHLHCFDGVCIKFKKYLCTVLACALVGIRCKNVHPRLEMWQKTDLLKRIKKKKKRCSSSLNLGHKRPFFFRWQSLILFKDAGRVSIYRRYEKSTHPRTNGRCLWRRDMKPSERIKWPLTFTTQLEKDDT